MSLAIGTAVLALMMRADMVLAQLAALPIRVESPHSSAYGSA